jgi:type II secretory pathway pseudopilin PulG
MHTRDPRASTGRARSRSGFTLVDIALAVTILVVAVAGLSGTVVSTVRLTRTSEESSDAYEALRSMAETIQGTQFDQVFALYTANPDFAVPGLTPVADDADGIVGDISFPTGGPGGLQLREDAADADLGMPRDLNGDGVIDGLDHAADYILLPVRLRLSWRGVSGDRTLDLSMLLIDQ